MALNCDPNALAQLAKCFKCLSPATLEEIQTFLLCQIANNGTGGGGGGGSGVTTFRSALIPLITPGQTLYSAAHGLIGVPDLYMARLVCNNNGNNHGFVVGQTINVLTLFNQTQAVNECDVYADAANVYMSLAEDFDNNGPDVVFVGATGGVGNIVGGGDLAGNFNLQFTALKFAT